jgi:DNA-binding protein Alba
MADKYRKVRNQPEKAPDNEVRITKRKPLRNYVTYVLSQFRERNATEVTLRSMGETMDKIVSVAEIVKYRVKGLYQVNHIGSQTFEDVFEPLEEGLDTLKFKRTVQYFTITLTKNKPADKTYGFQDPIPESDVDESADAPRGQGGNGGRRDGGRGG